MVGENQDSGIETEPQKPVFSRQSVQAKQAAAKDAYEKKVQEMRQNFEAVAAIPEGEKFCRYLFLICGGDIEDLRRNKDGQISKDETLVALGTKAVWATLRFNFKSETLKKIERHNWET